MCYLCCVHDPDKKELDSNNPYPNWMFQLNTLGIELLFRTLTESYWLLLFLLRSWTLFLLFPLALSSVLSWRCILLPSLSSCSLFPTHTPTRCSLRVFLFFFFNMFSNSLPCRATKKNQTKSSYKLEISVHPEQNVCNYPGNTYFRQNC